MTLDKYVTKNEVIKGLHNKNLTNEKKGEGRRLSINPVTLIVTPQDESQDTVGNQEEVKDGNKTTQINNAKSIKDFESSNFKIESGMNIIFDIFKNGDAKGEFGIDAKQLLAVFREIGDKNVSLEECEETIKEADKDGSGKVELNEFLSLFLQDISKSRDTEQELLESFEIIEAGKSGFVTAEQLKSLMELGDGFDETEMNHFISMADLDGDGIINYEALSKLMFDKEKKFYMKHYGHEPKEISPLTQED